MVDAMVALTLADALMQQVTEHTPVHSADNYDHHFKHASLHLKIIKQSFDLLHL